MQAAIANASSNCKASLQIKCSNGLQMQGIIATQCMKRDLELHLNK